jgi:hypothetical protein
VVRLRSAALDQILAHEQRERQVREPAVMEMAELAVPEPELGAAEPVPPRRDAGPRRDLANDGVVDGVAHS